MDGILGSDVLMTRVRRFRINPRLGVILLLTMLLPYLASAKRIAPVNVEPVTYQGLRYIAPNDDGRRGYIEAWDNCFYQPHRSETGGRRSVGVHQTLNAQDGGLMVTSEHGNTYEIDLKTKAIKQSDRRSSPSPEASQDIPDAVKRALTNGSLGKEYDISARINPSHLQGDFNGDGKIDAAVLVKQRSTGKIGIAIVSGTTGKETILGAGFIIGNGGDDFE